MDRGSWKRGISSFLKSLVPPLSSPSSTSCLSAWNKDLFSPTEKCTSLAAHFRIFIFPPPPTSSIKLLGPHCQAQSLALRLISSFIDPPASCLIFPPFIHVACPPLRLSWHIRRQVVLPSYFFSIQCLIGTPSSPLPSFLTSSSLSPPFNFIMRHLFVISPPFFSFF